jgi:hypothetical protein
VTSLSNRKQLYTCERIDMSKLRLPSRGQRSEAAHFTIDQRSVTGTQCHRLAIASVSLHPETWDKMSDIIRLVHQINDITKGEMLSSRQWLVCPTRKSVDGNAVLSRPRVWSS